MSKRLEVSQGSGGIYDAEVAEADVDFKAGRVPVVGDVREFDDGRKYVYVSTAVDVSASELVAIATCQATPIDGACTAAAIGANEVTIDTSAVAMFGGSAGVIAANRLAGGYLMINDDAGEGYSYRIKTNTVGTSATSITVTLYDKLIVALTTASDVVLVGPKYKKVVLGTATLQPLGAAVVASTAASDGEEQYIWVQFQGPGVVFVKTGASLAVGLRAVAAADGGIAVGASHTDIDVGICLATDATNSVRHPINFNIQG